MKKITEKYYRWKYNKFLNKINFAKLWSDSYRATNNVEYENYLRNSKNLKFLTELKVMREYCQDWNLCEDVKMIYD